MASSLISAHGPPPLAPLALPSSLTPRAPPPPPAPPWPDPSTEPPAPHPEPPAPEEKSNHAWATASVPPSNLMARQGSQPVSSKRGARQVGTATTTSSSTWEDLGVFNEDNVRPNVRGAAPAPGDLAARGLGHGARGQEEHRAHARRAARAAAHLPDVRFGWDWIGLVFDRIQGPVGWMDGGGWLWVALFSASLHRSRRAAPLPLFARFKHCSLEALHSCNSLSV